MPETLDSDFKAHYLSLRELISGIEEVLHIHNVGEINLLPETNFQGILAKIRYFMESNNADINDISPFLRNYGINFSEI